MAKPVEKRHLVFPNGNRATALFPSTENEISEIVDALENPDYTAVLVIIGGADNTDQSLVPVLTTLFEHGVAKAAAKTKAIIIDGGTKSGVMDMMGKGVAVVGHVSLLIGVVPLNKISLPGEGHQAKTQLDPNHSHFVLVNGENWGDETAMLFGLAKHLAQGMPLLVILTGGGKVAKNEVLMAVRENLPIIVLRKSGRLADEIDEAFQKKEALPEDQVMSEIIAKGNIHFYSVNDPVKDIESRITRMLSDKPGMRHP